MQLLSDLRDLFQLDTVRLKTITRKSLLKWSREVAFEARREKFYSSTCNGNLKSKVSICQKKGKRPDWTVRLEMLKTAEIRRAIISFLNDLQVYNVPKTNLLKISKARHWRKVLFLDEEALLDYEKTGGGGSGTDEAEPQPKPAKKKRGRPRKRKQAESSSSMPPPPKRSPGKRPETRASAARRELEARAHRERRQSLLPRPGLERGTGTPVRSGGRKPRSSAPPSPQLGIGPPRRSARDIARDVAILQIGLEENRRRIQLAERERDHAIDASDQNVHRQAHAGRVKQEKHDEDDTNQRFLKP